MATKNPVSVESLGLCEHCNALLVMEDMDSDAIQVIPDCPRCRKIISGASFGYDGNGQQAKVRWVDAGRTWITQRPAGNFSLDGLRIVVSSPPAFQPG